jgi:hypothetical protein
MNQEIKQEENTTTLVCYNHPNRETFLRCNRCNRPICTSCAVLTPTGYRCKECVRGQQKTFDTAEWIDYPLAFFVAGGLAFAGSLVAQVLGLFIIFLAPVIGVIIAEVVRWVVRRHRSRLLFQLATGGVLLGALPILLLRLLGLLFGGGSAIGLINLIWPAVYAFMVTSTVYYRLSGIRLT